MPGAAIWARPGLDRKTRSMITIAMLVGMGKIDELKLHIRATRNTGVSRDEVKELLMHAAIYCGVPGRLRRLPGRGADLRRDGQGKRRHEDMRLSLASLGAEPGARFLNRSSSPSCSASTPSSTTTRNGRATCSRAWARPRKSRPGSGSAPA